MRDRVMCVNDIQPEFTGHLNDLVRERQQVLWFPEQRVRRGQHLVKRQARLELSEAKRRFRADEMDLMTAFRERLTKLGSDDAAAPDGGVADDADVHRSFQSRSRCGRSTGSRTISPSAKSTPARAPNCASRLSISFMKRGDVKRVCTESAPGGRNWLA